MCTMCLLGAYTGQNRVSGVLECGCKPLCGFWELNLGLPQEQQEFLAAEPSLQDVFLILCICVLAFGYMHG